jgi:polysaccharide biosynthesis transport protein
MAEPGAEPALRSYLIVLRRRKWWVISIALLGLAGSLALSLTQAKQYSATAQLLVQPPGGNLVLNASQTQITSTDVQTELQLVSSAQVEQAVRGKLGSVPPVSAAEVAQTNVIALTAVSASPARAAAIANAYARAFVAYNTKVTVANLTAAEDQLRSQIAGLAREIRRLPARGNSASQASALANQEAVLKEQVAQLQVNGAVASGGLEFVTPAQAPAGPSSPRPAQDALLGLLAGLVLGLGAAFGRDSLDDAVSSTESAERASGAPVLAMVPMVSSWKKRDNPMVVASTEPSSQAAEAYRSLRTSLQFIRQARELRTLLVTSPAAAEGKTSTLANLGAVFAQAGERVVLVSCDLRRPRLGQFFDFTEESGLTTVLLGEQPLEQALRPVPGYDGLWTLGAGAVPPNPAELLGGERAREVFAALAEDFDLVLVDSPPVLPVTDAMILSGYADGALLVVAAGQTRRAELQRTTAKFAQAQAPVLGIVLNEVTRQSGYGGYYGGYGQRYGYPPDRSLAETAHSNGQAGAESPPPSRPGRRPQ